MAYKISKRQVEQLNMSNEASRRFGGIGLGSVIEEISKSGGGGGTPSDYDELQDTVSGHTQDIKTINSQIQTINENIEGLYNPDSIDAGDADNTDMNSAMLMRSVIKHTEETIEFSVVDSPKSENEYATIDEIADLLSETNRYSNIIINIKTSKDITYNTDTHFNGYGFRTLTLNFDRKINIDSAIYFKNFVDWVQKVVMRLQSMTKEQKEQIVKWGMFAGAIGPTLFVFCKLTSTVGKLMSAFGAVPNVISSVQKDFG